ncbi:crossover junction endodeoxyribonuclease RuvC [Patescibacteria group bacterium]|nr:crossover junction endodeoxyribonuclease RuvC [Patescibacteria group bacterium]
MRIIGVDPGIARTGWGVIEVEGTKYSHVSSGLIETPAGKDPAKRLEQLSGEIEKVLKSAKADQASVEKLFFNTNITTAMAVSEARGVILLACSKAKLPISEYTPLQIKQSVSSYGQASKDQVGRMVARLLKLPKAPKPDDVADALATAICHAGRARLPSPR